jgi:hypothetical protein
MRFHARKNGPGTSLSMVQSKPKHVRRNKKKKLKKIEEIYIAENVKL